ncbi:hypothetical protein NSMM_370051 [Nitrosomonas mobilis]|uniref:Uncharacterized protein n=1 Tax=Nitrosomonas mobilis TaxID=51642 RepID=A0A1G5SDQ7_9PROT|nr:hypothetical protein NSMM_370051 [Nitrosomonas mobilis]
MGVTGVVIANNGAEVAAIDDTIDVELLPPAFALALVMVAHTFPICRH